MARWARGEADGVGAEDVRGVIRDVDVLVAAEPRRVSEGLGDEEGGTSEDAGGGKFGVVGTDHCHAP
ncbi:hypothetical protein HPP92_020016 [Vanilla planifolia]|uniref:Uncharacterized protein n=1 Tax=Vanilla planifolia TaxID=51239 RepID=A0A835QDL7_VANPL|nr:hypothetical protein HPP92_020016 [Vanilla planifolia]